MNSLKGNISEIEVNGHLSLVTIRISPDVEFRTIIIETPETAAYLKPGTPINVLFKETEVILSTGDTDSLSIENKLKGRLSIIERGTLLSRVVVQTEAGEIVAFIGTSVVDLLRLTDNSEVTVLVKLNEILLSE